MAHRTDDRHGGRDDRARIWLLSAGLLAAAVLAAVSLGLANLYGEARERLDTSFGERLTGIAVTAARLVDGDSMTVWSYDPALTDGYVDLQFHLDHIAVRNNLSEVALVTTGEVVLLSASGRQKRGDFALYASDEAAAFEESRLGFAAQSGLYDDEGLIQKSAFAPIRDSRGDVVGAIVVEADADFFDSLATLEQGAWVTGGIVLLVLTALLAGLARLLRDIVRYRSSLAEQEKLAAMGRMTAGIAHEIRNPLGIMRGAGEALKLRLESAGEDATMAGFVIDEVDRLDGILTRYLTFGKGGGLACAPCDLEHLVRSTLRNLDDELAGVTTSCTVHGTARDVTIDSPALQQLLINVLLNARDAVAGTEGSVEIALDHGDESVIMTVGDNGPGLGSADPDDLFSPFRTTKEKGSGLGLSVVRQVAEDHGGSASIADRPNGSGALVTVTLPYDGPAEEGP